MQRTNRRECKGNLGMRKKLAVAFLLASGTLLAQMPAADGTSGGEVKRTPYYVDPLLLDLSTILPLPPTQDSETTRQELAYVHTIEQTRTPAQVAQVRQDDKEEDLFIFTT
jgi:acid phosphatase (class A)